MGTSLLYLLLRSLISAGIFFFTGLKSKVLAYIFLFLATGYYIYELYMIAYVDWTVIGLLYLVPMVFMVMIANALLPKAKTGNETVVSATEEKTIKPLTEKEIWRVKLPTTKGNHHIENLKAGVSIVASAGGGKTEGPIYALLDHFSKRRFSGIIYDYKNGELTEMAYPMWGNGDIDFRLVQFHDINGSNRINPLAPKYIRDEDDIKDIVKVLIANLTEGDAKGSNAYFYETAEKTLAAIIMRTLEDYPDYCTLPHIISIVLGKTLEELESYISKSRKASVLGAALLRSENEKAKNDVLSTLSNALTTIASPNVFMVLSGDDFDLRINDPDNPRVVSFAMLPRKERALAPVMAMSIQAITLFMMERNRNHSFLLLDEAPTINLKNMERIPSTMRSFGLTTIFTVQDKSLSDLTYSDKRTRAIFANLSTAFLGLAKDADTAEYNERLLELVDKKNISINKSASFLGKGETRKTISKKEERKYRAYDFAKLLPGEFIYKERADAKKIRFKKISNQGLRPKNIYNWSTREIEDHYYKILEEGKNLK